MIRVLSFFHSSVRLLEYYTDLQRLKRGTMPWVSSRLCSSSTTGVLHGLYHAFTSLPCRVGFYIRVLKRYCKAGQRDKEWD